LIAVLFVAPLQAQNKITRMHNFYRGELKAEPKWAGIATGSNPADFAAALKAAKSFSKKRRTPLRTVL
jgi:hypothetical protein